MAVRLWPPGVLLIYTVFVVGAAIVGLVGLGLLITGAAAGYPRWGSVATAVGVQLMAGMMIYGVLRVSAADARLGVCPEPQPDEKVLVSVHPVARGTAAAQAMMAVLFACGGVVYASLPETWEPPRVASRPAEWTPDEIVRMRDQTLWGPSLDPVSRVEMLRAPEAERIAYAGAGLTVIAFCLLAAVGFAAAFAWMVSNHERRFLWLSPDGIGYLPARLDDDGFLPWDEVTGIGYRALSVRGFTSQHRWIVESESKDPTIVVLPPGTRPKPNRVFEVLHAVAPHVDRR
ncbi:hypothetical protein [Gordonia iterans]